MPLLFTFVDFHEAALSGSADAPGASDSKKIILRESI
jgi:hypothetical protein